VADGALAGRAILVVEDECRAATDLRRELVDEGRDCHRSRAVLEKALDGHPASNLCTPCSWKASYRSNENEIHCHHLTYPAR
jgi:hypothetical protein